MDSLCKQPAPVYADSLPRSPDGGSSRRGHGARRELEAVDGAGHVLADRRHVDPSALVLEVAVAGAQDRRRAQQPARVVDCEPAVAEERRAVVDGRAQAAGLCHELLVDSRHAVAAVDGVARGDEEVVVEALRLDGVAEGQDAVHGLYLPLALPKL